MSKKKFTSLDENMLKTAITGEEGTYQIPEKFFGLTIKLSPSLYRRLVNAKLDNRGATNQSIMVQALEEWLDKKEQAK